MNIHHGNNHGETYSGCSTICAKYRGTGGYARDVTMYVYLYLNVNKQKYKLVIC